MAIALHVSITISPTVDYPKPNNSESVLNSTFVASLPIVIATLAFTEIAAHSLVSYSTCNHTMATVQIAVYLYIFHLTFSINGRSLLHMCL